MSIDVAQWQEQNRCPLYPGKLQEWVLIRAVPADYENNPEWITHDCWRALALWFDVPAYGQLTLGQTIKSGGPIDTVDVKRIAKTQLSFPSEIVKRREELTTLPIVKGTSAYWVQVTFAYRGTDASMPWPCWNYDGLDVFNSKQDRMAPFDCDWVLDTVWMPTATPAEAKGMLDSTIDAASDVATEALDVGGKILKPVLIGAGAIGALYLLVKVLR
jgi:hypothetical protein